MHFRPARVPYQDRAGWLQSGNRNSKPPDITGVK
jgi:hypothetical protein